MKIKPTAIVIADISGYTNFVRQHGTSLLHAEQIITDLLETIIETSAHPLTLNKLQGDSALFYASVDDRSEVALMTRDVLRQTNAFFESFYVKERELLACRLCLCDACRNVGQLRLKVVLHVGDVAFKQVRQFEELAGEPVIVAHRLMKNSIPTREYLLMTDTFYAASGGLAERTPESRREVCEGVGSVAVKVYYPSGTDSGESIPKPTLMDRLRLHWRVSSYAIRRGLGMKPAYEFKNIPK